jgi:hypothetical protein
VQLKDPALEYNPAAHAVHREEPGFEYVPSKHLVQFKEFGLEKYPPWHCVHIDPSKYNPELQFTEFNVLLFDNVNIKTPAIMPEKSKNTKIHANMMIFRFFLD